MHKLQHFTRYITIILSTVIVCLSAMENNPYTKYPVSIRHQQRKINLYVQNEAEKAEAHKQEVQILKYLNDKKNAEMAMMIKNKHDSSHCTYL